MKAFFLYLFVTGTSVQGVELTKFNLELQAIINKRDSHFPEYDVYNFTDYRRVKNDEVWNYDLDLNFDIQILETKLGKTYWTNTIHSGVTTKQFRYVGWEFEFGQELGKNLDLIYYHFSEHAMDEPGPRKYPLQDSVGIRFNLIK